MDSFRLETISEIHPLATEVFIPFVVARLQEHPEDREANLALELHDISGTATKELPLRLYWEAASISKLPLAIPDNSLTEWAALGIACAVIWEYAGLRLHAVAAAGDRFDYWVMQEMQEFALEVSGTTGGNLEDRHREKISQLLDNPYGIDGYVVVVGFKTRRVILSFHKFGACQ